jgi:hypothetical protein
MAESKPEPPKEGGTPRAESLDWTKVGTIIAALSLVITYFGAAYSLHWPPYTRQSDSASPSPANTRNLPAFVPTATPAPITSPSGSALITSPSASALITSLAPSVSSTGFTGQETYLLNQLTVLVFTRCSPQPADENSDIIAALSCVPAKFGPAIDVGVYEYKDPAALQRAMASSVAAVSDNTNDCESGAYVGSWNHDGINEGSKVCQLLSNGSVEIHWSFDALSIIVAVQGSSGQYGIQSWWTGNAYCIKH